ncbi:uncharacterized protein LOC124266116 [Haliotis rubra]|uniref:uncharacterized protein LOC124266116 n=1 Tax=Haliotis rubra TaxID=36100 RepID=UPI001EE52E10|nr:uncharacterized protein LOC124266116 [Haliotis rubra]
MERCYPGGISCVVPKGEWMYNLGVGDAYDIVGTKDNICIRVPDSSVLAYLVSVSGPIAITSGNPSGGDDSIHHDMLINSLGHKLDGVICDGDSRELSASTVVNCMNIDQGEITYFRVGCTPQEIVDKHLEDARAEIEGKTSYPPCTLYESNKSSDLRAAAAILSNGGVEPPANTPESIRRLYTVKERPATKPICLCLSNLDQLKAAKPDFSPLLWNFMERCYPGGISCVVPKGEWMYNLGVGDAYDIVGTKDNICIRVPDSSVLAYLVSVSGPIAITSGNPSGGDDSIHHDMLINSLGHKLDGVICDGDSRELSASTVVNCMNIDQGEITYFRVGCTPQEIVDKHLEDARAEIEGKTSYPPCTLYESNKSSDLRAAAAILSNGGVVGTPTDTVYAIGASCKHPESIRRLYTVKERPATKPICLCLSNLDQLKAAKPDFSPLLWNFMERCYPGGISCVVPKGEWMYNLGVGDAYDIVGTKDNICIRVPDSSVLAYLVSVSGPIAITSGNPSGGDDSIHHDMLINSLGHKLDGVICDGDSRELSASTVVNCMNIDQGEITYFRVGCTPQEIVDKHLEDARAEIEGKTSYPPCTLYESNKSSDLRAAAAILSNGGVVGTPTDTVYAIGASCKHPESIRRLYTVKERPATKPICLCLSNLDQLKAAKPDFSPLLWNFMERCYPGGISCVVPKGEWMYNLGVGDAYDIVGTKDNICIRVPDSSVLAYLVSVSGPIAITSGNPSGGDDSIHHDMLINSLGHKLDGVICDGDSRELSASTVVNCMNIDQGEITYFRVGCTPQEIVDKHLEDARAEIEGKTSYPPCTLYESNKSSDLRAAAAILSNGGVVGTPTDTVYAIGASCKHPESIRRLYTVKERPATKPICLCLSNLDQLKAAKPDFSPLLWNFMERCYPGGISCVVPKGEWMYNLGVGDAYDIVGTKDNICIRVPDSSVLAYLVSVSGPIAITSGNPSGGDDSIHHDMLINSLGHKLDGVICDGDSRELSASTVVNCMNIDQGEITYFRVGCTPQEIVDKHLEDARAEIEGKTSYPPCTLYESNKSSDLRAAAAILSNGGVVGTPTDTVYAIGASCKHPESIRRLYTVKERPATKPICLCLSNLDQLKAAKPDFSPLLWNFMERCYPGGISCVVPKGEWMYNLGVGDAYDIVGTKDNICIRVPDSSVLAYLVSVSGPIAITSGNPSGGDDSIHHDMLINSLGHKLDGVICDGDSRELSASTVVNCMNIDQGEITYFRVGCTPQEIVDKHLEDARAEIEGKTSYPPCTLYESNKSSDLRAAAAILSNGGVVGTPTDTVYAIGASCKHPESIRRLYTVKERPATKPICLCLSNLDQLKAAKPDFSPLLWNFMERCYPGGISCVVPKGEWMYNLGVGDAYDIVGTKDSVCIRVPDSSVMAYLVSVSGPIAITSGNPSGGDDSIHHDMLINSLGDGN